MLKDHSSYPNPLVPNHGTTSVWGRAVAALVALQLLAGCAAVTNPTQNGIPVRRLPTEILTAPRRENCQTIPLSLLRQNPPDEYLLAPGDVLGVYIPGVIPPSYEDQPLTPPPVNYPVRIDPTGAGLPPSVGYPIPIRQDGKPKRRCVEAIWKQKSYRPIAPPSWSALCIRARYA
jgi:hypothetical protein